RALEVVGLSEREMVRAALRATAVKRSVDLPTFEQLFELYFSGLGEAIKELEAATRAALDLDADAFQQMLEDLQRFMEEQGIELSELAQALLRSDTGRLERLLREAAARGQLGDIQHGFQEGRFTHGLAQALGLGSLTAELESLKGRLGGLDPE